MKITLYKINTNNVPMMWSIHDDGDRLIINYGQIGGSIQTQVERVEVNQSGRGIREQVALRMRSRIGKQKDRGYCNSLEEAKSSKGMNALKLAKPMLAKKFKDVTHIDFKNSFLQYKYNGHRCLITCQDGVKMAYSRNGKPIDTIDHILETIAVPEGYTLDGELYCHGQKLQTIASWAKRKQADTLKLNYMAYDLMDDENIMPYSERHSLVKDLVNGRESIVAEYWKYNNEPIKYQLDNAIAQGYEGLMLRQNNGCYEVGARSCNLLKIKQCLDEEFLVVDIIPSTEGWGILVCKVGNSTFKVSAPGTMENKYKIYRDKQAYIGRYITVEFFEWTIDQKPFHPVAIEWRRDL